MKIFNYQADVECQQHKEKHEQPKTIVESPAKEEKKEEKRGKKDKKAV